jgi:DNA-binding XRE family transcriptional regulator
MRQAMIKHQIVNKDGRPHSVRVPIAEWRRLEKRLAALEEAADQRAYDTAKARGGEMVPASIVDALLDGRHPIKALRAWRGLTQAELASKAGIAKLYVSQIETGRRTGTAKTLQAIAAALEVDLEMVIGRKGGRRR